jgi:hypothetical protein
MRCIVFIFQITSHFILSLPSDCPSLLFVFSAWAHASPYRMTCPSRRRTGRLSTTRMASPSMSSMPPILIISFSYGCFTLLTHSTVTNQTSWTDPRPRVCLHALFPSIFPPSFPLFPFLPIGNIPCPPQSGTSFPHTRVSSQPPPLSMLEAQSLSQRMPPGYQLSVDPDGRPFFFDPVTQTALWPSRGMVQPYLLPSFLQIDISLFTHSN